MLDSVHGLSVTSTQIAFVLQSELRECYMIQSLLDRAGRRKYLVAAERVAFAEAAVAEGGAVGAFCLTLAITGARISEALALTVDRIDAGDQVVVFETLKQRKRGIYRAVPVPSELIDLLLALPEQSAGVDQRLWPWCRTTAWKHVRRIMQTAGVPETFSQPKALRHGFAIEAGQNGVQLNVVQRWLGHARIETTALYSGALGEEERLLARRTWHGMQKVMTPAKPLEGRRKGSLRLGC
jgi:integrase